MNASVSNLNEFDLSKMEVNDFMDLNTTELFDDSNDSFDENQEYDECDSNIIAIGKTKSDIGNISTNLTTTTNPEIGTSSSIPSGLSIIQKATKAPTISSDAIPLKKTINTENTSIQFNLKPTTVISKATGVHDIVTNIEIPTVSTAIMSRSNEPSIVSIRQQSLIRPKVTSIVPKGQINTAKYAKLQTALAGTMTDSTSINTATKLVKIAPSTTSLSIIPNAMSDMKTSPVIIVQAPSQKLGQKFTSLKILQKCPSPGSTVVKPKILNFNEMRQLNSGGSLKPIILNATTPNTVISLSDGNSSSLPSNSLGYVMPSASSLIVLKQPTTSAVATITSTSSTFHLKPQQLYQPIVSPNPTKPTTYSIVTTSPNTCVAPKSTSVSIGTKLIPSRILTAVKANTTETLTVTTTSQHPLPVGLTKIPKDTIVKQIPTKDAQGASIDFLKMIKAKQSEKSIEPTVTIGQKQMSNKPALEYQSLTNFLSSNDKPKALSTINTSKYHDHQTPMNLQVSNGELIEKIEENKLDKDVESITISNGTLSNPNGSIKMLKSVTDLGTADGRISKPSSSTTNDDISPPLKDVETSPRLKERSKSLTISKEKPKKVRRRFASHENSLPMITTIEKLSKHLRIGTIEKLSTNLKNQLSDDKDNSSSSTCATIEEIDEQPEEVKEIPKAPIKNEQKKVVRNSLECDEKIDDSDKSKSVSPDVGGEGVSGRPNPNPVKTVNPPVTTSSYTDYKNDDPLSYMKWRNGIGYLKYSNLQFRKNEFGLLEIYEIKEFSKNPNNSKQPLIGQRNEQIEQMDCVEKKTDVSDKSGAMGKKKLESKQRFKKAGLHLLQNVFVWELYLKLMDAQAAPDHLFINPFPSSANLFEVGMKLEAIDPEHCSLFCVCTVIEKLGYRIRLAFDGYSDRYSFWRNADSMDIFPPGWCAKNGRPLQPPMNYGSEPFDWHRYILKTNGKFAPRSNFTHLNSMTSRNPFKVGMKLEADNVKLGREKLCVATVADVLDNRILVRFDSFDDTYDYWTDITSANIHPYDWHKISKCRLIIPKEFEKTFSWPHYFASSRSQPVPKEYFCPRTPIAFQEGMKLEIVDKKVQTLIRPCTVIQVVDYYIQVLFDGWPSTYAYWIEDDHPDIHPINWCLRTEHPLEPPLNFGPDEFRSACGVLGCREVGNAKHFGLGFHYTIFECPYESRNWLSIDTKPDRLFDMKAQKVKKRKVKSIMSVAAAESYKKVKIEPPSSEENSLQNPPLNDWTANEIPVPVVVKNEEIEIGETKVLTTELHTLSPEITSTSLPKHIKVTESILHDYGPGIMNIHKLWVENSKPVNIRRIAENPICWTIDEVVDYVTRLPNCSRLGNLFRDHEIDGDAFLKLCQNDLVDILKIRLGPSVKIYNQIVALRSEVCEMYMDSE